MNRNRILHPRVGWQYLSVPLSNSSRNIRIYQAKILDPCATKSHFKRKLYHYKNIAPYYSSVIDLVEDAFEYVDNNCSLTSLCHGSISVTCNYLGIAYDSLLSSSLNIKYPENIQAGQWAVYIANHLNASGYLNPISGAKLFNNCEFQRFGLDLKFLERREFTYNQYTNPFIADLSVLDAMMWLPPDVIRKTIIENVNILDPDDLSND